MTSLNTLLYRYLKRGTWYFEIVALILHKQQLSEIPAQRMEGCFLEALRGSMVDTHEAMKKVLILLIKAGIDLCSCNPIEFADLDKFLASCRECDCYYDLYNCKSSRGEYNQDFHRDCRFTRRDALVHRDIWVEALITCGHDAEYVILNMPPTTGCPCENDYELQVSENSWFTSSDELESSVVGKPNCFETQSNASEVSYDLEDDHLPTSANNTLFEEQDWSVLEGDAAVWRT